MEHQGIWFYTSFHSQHLLACLVHGRCPIKSISMGVFFFLGLYFSQYTIHRFSHQLTQAPPHRYWVCKKEKSGSVAQSCPTLCDPIGCSPPGLPVHHQLPEFTETHVHSVGGAIQPSHPLSSPSPSIFSSIRVFSNEFVLCISWPKY